MTAGKTIALTRQNFVGKVMSLLFHMLSRLVITFLPRSKQTPEKMKERGVWQTTAHEVAKNWTGQWLNSNSNDKLLFGNNTSKLQSWSWLNSCSLNRGCCLTILSSCCSLLFLFSVFPGIKIFSKESALPIRLPKYWSFRFIISPFNEYSVLTSFRIDWFDFLWSNNGKNYSLSSHTDAQAYIIIDGWAQFFFAS